MKTLVIFDIDGTLLYSNKLDSQCFADSYQRVFGKVFPTIDWTKFKHVTDHTIFHTAFHSHFNTTCSLEDIHHFQDDYIGLMSQRRVEAPHDFCEVPGAKQIINDLLSDDQYTVGIATGGWKRPALFKLDYIGIDIEPIYDSYADEKHTREEILQESIDNASSDHIIDKIIYIGDAVWDVKTTNSMQLPLIGIRRDGDHEVLRDLGVQHVLTDFTDSTGFQRLLQEI